MNIDKIMLDLKEYHIWADKEGDGPVLGPCPFCGGEARLVVARPIYGASGAAVRCCRCHMRGPNASIHAMIVTPNRLATPVLPESLERGINTAVAAWNSRTVDPRSLGNLRVTEAPA